MRKLFLSLGVLLCLSAVSVSAQDTEREKGTTTNNGQQILPQAGDFAIGVDASPMFKFVGNMFNNSSDNQGDSLFSSPRYGIYGKYFLTNNTALRAKLLFNFDSRTDKSEVQDVNDAAKQVENSENAKLSEFGLELGYEWRRGYGRLQGFVGPQIGIMTSNVKESFKYGNSLSDKELGPRETEKNYGTTFEFSAGGFVGVEYFVAPKISVGGEFGLNFVTESRGKGNVTTERWITSSSSSETKTTEYYVNPASSTGFQTKTNGNIFVMFHF